MLFKHGFTLLLIASMILMPVLAQDELEKATEKNINLDKKQNNVVNNENKKRDWTYRFHQRIANSVYYSAAWFDSFFMEEGDEQLSPKTSARIKLGWEPKARDWGEFGTRFKLKVRLPHFKDKVDVIFSDSDEDQFENLPLESLKVKNDVDNDSFSAAIRYIFKDKENVVTDSRIGISGGDLFVRARHKRTYTWHDKHSFKFEPALYYYLDDKFGSRLLLEYNYQYDDQEQYRINYSIRGSQSFHGIRWKHGFYHLKQFSDHDAMITGIQAEGERNGERGFVIDKYLLSARYRFNAFKDWLFFEIEPFFEFPEEANYKATPGIAFRVEGFFYRFED